MNISDLQQVLRERAGEASSDQPDLEWLVGKGQARRRRRRMATVGAAAVLVAGAVTVPVLLSGGSDSGSGPATLVPTVSPSPTASPSLSTAPAPTPSAGSPTPTGPAASTSIVPPSAPVTTAPVVSVPPSQPSVDASILAYGDCQTPTLEPSRIVTACADYGLYFQDLQWTSWTSTTATGTGTEVYNDCTPSCAEGTRHSVPGTTVTLSLPVSDPDGRLVWSQIQFSPEPPGYATGPYHGGPEPLPIRPE